MLRRIGDRVGLATVRLLLDRREFARKGSHLQPLAGVCGRIADSSVCRLSSKIRQYNRAETPSCLYQYDLHYGLTDDP